MRKIIFDAVSLPDEHQRKEMWVASLSSGYTRLHSDPASDVPFRGELKIALLDSMSIGTVRGTVKNISRFAVDITGDNSDNIALLFNDSPYVARVEQSGKRVDLDPGAAVLIEECEPSHVTTAVSACAVLAIKVPRQPLCRRIRGIEDRFVTPIAASSAALALMRSYADVLLDHPDDDNPIITRLLPEHVLDLVVSIIETTDRDYDRLSNGVRAARLAMIRREIDRNFVDMDFSLVALARRLAVTPRYVQRLLAEMETSFSDELTRRRLNRAHDMLSSSRHLHVNVIEVAHECGFSSVSHFHRMFRRQFNETPGGVRAIAIRQDRRC